MFVSAAGSIYVVYKYRLIFMCVMRDGDYVCISALLCVVYLAELCAIDCKNVCVYVLCLRVSRQIYLYMRTCIVICMCVSSFIVT